MLVVTIGPKVVGHVELPPAPTISPLEQERAIERQLGSALWQELASTLFICSARRRDRRRSEPVVTVVVVSDRGGEALAACLGSLNQLSTPPKRKIVIPREQPRILERIAAVAKDSDLVALTKDRCTVDYAWLDDLGDAFANPVTAVVLGYVGGPAYSGGSSPVRVRSDENVIVRRDVLERLAARTARSANTQISARIASLAGDLGLRVLFDPTRIVWPQPPDGGPGPIPSRRHREKAGGPPPPPAAPTPLTLREAGPPLSVVIPSHNRREKLSATLGGFARQTYDSNRFEVIVVLDGSQDGSAELLETYRAPHAIRVIQQDHAGVAAARNRGVSEARHPVIVFLDDDIVPEPAFLALHAEFRRDAGERDVISGYCPPVIDDRRFWDQWLRVAWEDYYTRASEPDHQWSFMDFASANVSLTRSFFLDCGGFDPAFRRRNEERELGIRILAAGARFSFSRDLVAHHYLDTRFETELRHMRELARSDVLIARKHPRVGPQLGLAGIPRNATPVLSPRAFLAYSFPWVGQRLVESALEILPGLQRLHLRGAWFALARGLLTHAYLLGLRDAVPDYSELVRLLEPLAQPRAELRVGVALDSRTPLSLPSTAGPIDLGLTFAEVPLGQVRAIEAGAEWNWAGTAQRVGSATAAAAATRIELTQAIAALRSMTA